MCVLRAAGLDFDADAFARTSSLPIITAYRRGQLMFPHTSSKRKRTTNGVHINISDASWNNLQVQIDDAEQFLEEHHEALLHLHHFPGVEEMSLDFPANQRIGLDSLTQFEHFPPSLIRAAAKYNMAIELSIYPCEKTDAKDRTAAQ